MLLERNSELAISSYLHLLMQAERVEDAKTRPTEEEHATRVQKFIRLRAMEFYWTTSRALRNCESYFFPERVASQKKYPAWRRFDAPFLIPERPVPSSYRLLIDMTSTLRSGKNTGIQRVVREIARNVWEMGAGIPVAIHDGKLISSYRCPNAPDTIDIARGDSLLLLDAGWNHTDEYLPILREIRAKGGASIACLYDILPVIYPSAFPTELCRNFEEWLSRVVLESDGVVADSRATADSLRDFLVANGRSAHGVPLGWWKLGANFSEAADGRASIQARRIANGRPFFLGVGTIEPRKGYPLVLDAFERLWGDGVDAAYVVVGGRGWGMRAFETRLRDHPEFGRRLFWLERATDADLALLYRRARAVVLASVAEGFGLPIVEAANVGTPIIATDIPVFREVAGDSASYFDLLNSDSLAARLREACLASLPSPEIALTTWRESTTQLLSIVRDGAFQTRL